MIQTPAPTIKPAILRIDLPCYFSDPYLYGGPHNAKGKFDAPFEVESYYVENNSSITLYLGLETVDPPLLFAWPGGTLYDVLVAAGNDVRRSWPRRSLRRMSWYLAGADSATGQIRIELWPTALEPGGAQI